MFSLFRKRKKDAGPLSNWQLPLDASYKSILNQDSVQYVNESGSRVLYFSVLTFSGSSLLPDGILKKMAPTVTLDDGGWHLKGAKQGANEILNCVFTFTNKGDEAVMRELFDNIVYVPISS
ncbi:MAG TPA: hypothetical protein VHE34_14885 [Puia sp.]|uniref:hypothetical protein n=1 Tax=Puia sp. TaxID=2045100 RepID=UPI002BCBBFA1|nr:hypothetical protein [Puia sp.]HVU96511.1 hypothetical protein [Puia sp.]